MKKTILQILIALLCLACFGQSEELEKLANKYQNEIKLPFITSKLDTHALVDKTLLNELLFEKQEERAKFYSNDGKLINATTYGKIPEKQMKWKTWADESHTVRVEKTFTSKAYALGNIDFGNNYTVWLTKVVGFQKTYIDLYVFDKSGKLKSLVNLYEAEYESNGDPSEIANIYITSSITKAGVIKWEENRFNVQTKREYELQPDGYFKVIKEESEGEFEL